MLRIIAGILSCVLLLCTVAAGAAEGDGLSELYPIEVNGKWGYADAEGRIVIEPQWAEAGQFSKYGAYVSFGGIQDDGLIAPDGSYLLPPEYMIIERPFIFEVGQWIDEETWLEGYLDKESGFCIPPRYEDIYDNFPSMNNYVNSELIGAKQGGKHGFLYRATGETAIPFVYDDILAKFCGGYALVMNIHDLKAPAEGMSFPERMDGMRYEYLLIDAAGRAVDFGEKYTPVSGATPGGSVIVLKEAETDAERSKALWGDAVYGLAKVSGEIILEPCYGYIDYFQSGYASVVTGESRWGVIDESGAIVIEPRFESEEALLVSDEYSALDIEHPEWQMLEN